MAKYIFHHACRTCFSQETFDKYRCAKCWYFDNDRQLQSLHLSRKEMELLEAESARREIKGLSFNKEEKEAYMWLLREQAKEQAREEEKRKEVEIRLSKEFAEEKRREAEIRPSKEFARREGRWLEVRNGQLVEYETKDSLGEKILRLLRGIVLGR